MFEYVLLAITLFLVALYLNQRQYRKQLKLCKKELAEFIRKSPSNSPLLLRLAWSDACTYNIHLDNGNASWPVCGGCNGSIRFKEEFEVDANGGLHLAIEMLKPLKRQYGSISWADLVQLAGALAVESCGGPEIVSRMKFGRVDAPSFQSTLDRSTTNAANRYPVACPPFPEGAKSAEQHLRSVCQRMGLDDAAFVALCGAHTIGRAFGNRSGNVCKYFSGDMGATAFTASHYNPTVSCLFHDDLNESELFSG